jgi:hypothetical protein
LRAAAVVQRSCTTAIEAGLAGVPALSPVWIPIFEEMPAAEAVSIPCASPEALEDALTGALAGELELPPSRQAALRSIVSDWFLAIDGAAHQRVAAGIVSRTTAGDRAARALRFATGPPRQRARSWIKAAVPPSLWRLRPGRREPAWRRSEKQFSLEQVAAVIEGLEEAGHGGLGADAAQSHQVWRYRHSRAVTVLPRGSRRTGSVPRPG